jgi:hypothetical protein
MERQEAASRAGATVVTKTAFVNWPNSIRIEFGNSVRTEFANSVRTELTGKI